MPTRDFLGKEWKLKCMGCDIAGNSMIVPGGIIKEDKYFIVHQDPLIPLPGFIVIASKRHFKSIDQMNSMEYKSFVRLLLCTQIAIKQALKTKYLTIVQEESSIHFHLWFFPWSNDVIKLFGEPSLASIREIMKKLKEKSITNTEWKKLEKTIVKIKTLINRKTEKL